MARDGKSPTARDLGNANDQLRAAYLAPLREPVHGELVAFMDRALEQRAQRRPPDLWAVFRWGRHGWSLLHVARTRELARRWVRRRRHLRHLPNCELAIDPYRRTS